MQNPLHLIHDHTLPDWLKNLRHLQLGSREPDAPQVTEEFVEYRVLCLTRAAPVGVEVFESDGHLSPSKLPHRRA